MSVIDGALASVAPPRRVTLIGAGTPVAVSRSADGRAAVFMLSGRRLSVFAAGDVTPLGTLPGDFLCCADTGRRIIFMTSAGPWTVECAAGVYTVLGGEPRFPAVGFRAVDAGTFSATTRQVALTGSYPRWSGPLAKADRRLMTDALLGAYRECVAAAGASSSFVAPVLAWYRVLDADGVTLYRSQPVMLAPAVAASSAAVDVTVARVGESYSSAGASRVTARAFAVAVTAPSPDSSEWGKRAAALEVYVTPPLDAVDFTGDAGAVFASSTASEGVLRLSFPQFPDMGSRVAALLDRIEAVGVPAARFVSPFQGGISPVAGTVVKISAGAAADPLTVQKNYAALFRRAAPESPGEWGGYHSFAARAACVTGDMVTWADITPVHALPQGVGASAVTVSPGKAWSAVTRVTIGCGAGGEELLSVEESGTGNAPLTLSPLVAYPHPAAVRMDVEVTCADGVARLSLPLVPTPCGTMACYMSPGVSPVALTFVKDVTSQPLTPALRRVPLRRCGCLLTTSVISPMEVESAVEVSQAPVVAVTPAVRSAAAWDFARRHLYAFGLGGIHAVAVSGGRTAVSSHPVDPRPVESAAAVAWSPGGVYVAASGQLLRLAGTRTEVVAGRFAADAIGWCGADNSLHLISGGCDRMVMSAGGAWYSAPAADRRGCSLISGGGAVLLSDGESVADVAVAEEGRPVPILFYRRVSAGSPAAVKAVECSLRATGASLTLSLCGDNGSGHPHLIASMDVDGDVNAPLVLPVIFPCPFIFFTVSLSGIVKNCLMTECNLKLIR